MRLTRFLPLALAAALVGSPALAHHFWIQPESFHPAPDAVAKIGLRVGDDFPGEPVARKASRIDKFVVLGPEGEKPIAGEDGAEPAGTVRPDKPGLYVIGYRSKTTSITLEAPKFEAYLAEENLQDIIAIRKQRGESEAPGREIYSRCAKSFLTVGENTGSPADRPLGFRLELIAESAIPAPGAGPDLALRLVFEGKACPGRVIVARNPDHADATVRATTDKDGRVKLKLAQAGMWVITTVHMTPAAAPESTPDSASGEDKPQWESLWASLTLDMPAARK